MSSSSFYLNTLHLIHNLKTDNPSTSELLGLLGQSDIDLTELNILRNESETAIGKNLQQNIDASLLKEADMLTSEEKKFKVFRRETPFISSRIPASSPTWARGAKPAHTLGPFLSLDGRNFWFDFYFYERLIPVYVSGDAAPVMLLPLHIFLFQGSTIKYNVGDGSIWMRADLFAAGLTNTHYFGLNINSGELEMSEAHDIINDTLTINGSELFRLKLILNNTFINTGTGIEGIDARNAVVKLPEAVEFEFSSGKFSMRALSGSSWELYRDERNFTWQQAGAVVFNTFLNRLVFPLDTDKSRFKIENCNSDFFNISEKAKVVSSGWCLNVAQMNTAQPFTVGGNGALGILCGNGLQYKWKGLAKLPGILNMNAPLIMAEPGKFSVSDAFPLFKQHTELYNLWKRDASGDIRTIAELLLKKDKPFIYYCDQAGYESVAASVDANFETDKPFKADGTSVSPKTIDSLYIKYVTPTLRNMFVYDLDMLLQANPSFNHLQKPEIFQFAITNAYMITTPPSSLLLTGSFDDENVIVNGMLNIAYGLFILTPILPHPYTANLQLTEFGVNAQQLKDIREVTEWYPLLTNYVMSTCVWDDANMGGDTVNVDFELLTDLYRTLTNQTSGPEVTKQATMQMMQQDILEEFSLVENGITNNDTYGRNLFSLLDLSTNYDLFGVNMMWNGKRYLSISNSTATTISTGVVTIEKMNLQTPMALLNAFTLPHISWEPVNNRAKAQSGYPPIGILSFRDNGPPTIFSQIDFNPLDIDPLKYMERFRENIINSKIFSYAIFGLPHGKVSLAFLNHFSEKYASVKGNYDFIRPEFKESNNNKVRGGLQFRISASNEFENRPMIPGVTNQLSNLVHNNSNIPQSVLGGVVHQIFLNNFYLKEGTTDRQLKPGGVPITHIDFSGYGASMFSDWRNPKALIAQVSQTRFDVLIGRVSHEIVQVVSILYPWGIKVVRTITLYRSENAVIYREDSGWVAQSEGLFDFYFKLESGEIKNPFSFHPGHIKGLFNIHNIKDVDEEHIKFPYNIGIGENFFDGIKVGPSTSNIVGEAEFAAVTFDADVEIENISSGESNGKVAGKSFKGYLQVSPQAVPINAAALKKIFEQQQNSIGGSVDCTMKIGGSKQLMKVNRIDVSASFQNGNINDHIFVVAAKGSIQLPSEGSWSIVEVDKGTGDVAPVTNKQSVPVIRKGEIDRGKRSDATTKFVFVSGVAGRDSISRIAFADSLVANNIFMKRYGYVQNTGSQKLLLTDPRIDKDKSAELISEAPLLADTYRLLNSKGPFPNLGNAIKIEAVAEAVTNILPDGMQKSITGFKVPKDSSGKSAKFDIIGKDGEALHMYVDYQGLPSSETVINYVTDSVGANPEDKWKSNLDNISVAVDMGPFKKLLTISGDMKSQSSFDPKMELGNAPQLTLCPELRPIYEILEFLSNLDPSNPVEAIKKGLKIYMSNTADSWEYKFKAEKVIPVVRFPFDSINYNSPTTPIKLDAYFKIGCYFNQPIKIPNAIDQLIPSAGAYLELGADLRIMCFSLAAATVYATGRAQVSLSADIKNNAKLYFKFGFGIELCVGLPVIGSVSVMYLVGVDMELTEKALTVGAFIYFRGRAEILGGIVTITIQIEAAGKIRKELNGGPTNCFAVCTFALDISIFLIINISFTETWGETRQIA
ncbi:MAG: hypothetical protein M3R36_18865 [Bacteroidota bacterium]|nr:hypothetical protein [Bacteroidota bacterium]